MDQRENTFVSSAGDAYAIYQLRETQQSRGLLFESLDALRRSGRAVERSNYEAVYAGVLPKNRQETADLLEALYLRFNVDLPPDYTGHSLSVSDVVALKRDGEIRAYYVDRIGFRELDGFVPVHPLRNAEMSMEDDYGMIDGIINNGKREAVEAKARVSVTEQLKRRTNTGKHKKEQRRLEESR